MTPMTLSLILSVISYIFAKGAGASTGAATAVAAGVGLGSYAYQGGFSEVSPTPSSATLSPAGTVSTSSVDSGFMSSLGKAAPLLVAAGAGASLASSASSLIPAVLVGGVIFLIATSSSRKKQNGP